MRKLAYIFMFFPLFAISQVASVSPYSLFGVGELSEGYFLKNISMGGTGIALRDPIFTNLVNPASYDALELTTLDIGVSHRIIRQTELSSGLVVENQLTYFHYFGLGMKFTDKWGFAAALTPYSTVGYDIFTEENHDDFGATKYTFEGEGGIDQVLIGTSYEVVKNLSLGANARYLFGTADKSTGAEFENTSLFNSKRKTRLRVSDLTFDFGMQYRMEFKEKYDLTLGATYGLSSEMNAERSFIDYNYRLSNGIEYPVDTTNFITNKGGNVVLPTKMGFGVSYGEQNENIYSHSWLVTADYSATQWSEYKNFDGESNMTDSWRASLGAYFIPGFAFNKKTGRRSYFSQIEWRLGGFYESGYISSSDNIPLINQGATLGFSLPFKPRNLAPGEAKLNNFSFGIEVGSRSSESNNIINEEYINLTFGLTLNDLWFQKRKYR